MEKSQVVSGTWINELGSIMVLEENKCGQISGTYTTYAEHLRKSKSSNSPGETADIVGYINIYEKTEPPITTITTTIAFCMAWKIEGSCSAFSGQLFQDEKGDVLKTTWLLRSPADSLAENWEATCVGENTFRRKN